MPPSRKYTASLLILLSFTARAEALFDRRPTIIHKIQSLNRRDEHRRQPKIRPSQLHQRGGAVQITTNDEQYKISLSPLAFMSIFAFLGGWSHALCNKRFDAYTAMVSGHIINMSVSLAEKEWKEAFWRMSIIGSYFGGVSTGRYIEMKCERGQDEKGKGVKDAAQNNQHFKIIAALVVIIFALAEKLEKVQVDLLTFGYGLIYPAASSYLGGTIVHLLTGHTTNVARLVGANQIHHKGMKTSVCILSSVILGAIFGTKSMSVLGADFPYFTMLGFLYAAVLLLL